MRTSSRSRMAGCSHRPEGILQGVESRGGVGDRPGDTGVEAVHWRRHVTPYDFYTADEAFFCTTAGGIMPIVEIDGTKRGRRPAG